MLTVGLHIMLVLVLVAALAVSACTFGGRDTAPRDAAVAGAATVTLAVDGMV